MISLFTRYIFSAADRTSACGVERSKQEAEHVKRQNQVSSEARETQSRSGLTYSRNQNFKARTVVGGEGGAAI